MAFVIVQLNEDGSETVLPGWEYDDASGRAAAETAKKYSDLYGGKFQPRHIDDGADWRLRMPEHIAAMGYRPLPEAWTLAPIPDHYLCLGYGKNDTSLYYIDGPKHGARGRFTPIRPGRYLERFYPSLNEEARKHLIAVIDPPVDLHFAWSAEEIVEVYVNGPSSCMAYRERPEWRRLPCHPVSVYAAGDLAIAYIRNASGEISGRALCWPARKIYGRIYGDSYRLEKALKEAGYAYERFFVGARIRRVLFPEISLSLYAKRVEKAYVLPYFDNINGLEDRGDVLVSIDSTIGYESAEPFQTIIDRGTAGWGDLHRLCPKIREYAPLCDFLPIEGTGESWSRAALNHGYAFLCDGNGKAYLPEQRVDLWDGQRWSNAHFQAHGFTCWKSGRKCPDSDRLIDDKGRSTSRDYLEQERRDREYRERMRDASKHAPFDPGRISTVAEVRRRRDEDETRFPWSRVEIPQPARTVRIDPERPYAYRVFIDEPFARPTTAPQPDPPVQVQQRSFDEWVVEIEDAYEHTLLRSPAIGDFVQGYLDTPQQIQEEPPRTPREHQNQYWRGLARDHNNRNRR